MNQNKSLFLYVVSQVFSYSEEKLTQKLVSEVVSAMTIPDEVIQKSLEFVCRRSLENFGEAN
jgi:hypothetical protein